MGTGTGTGAPAQVHMERARALLRTHWGHDDFRGAQAEAIDAVLRGRDVLVMMATGAGKSLCYQIPALVRQESVIVVSPLVSLMQDQVMALERRGISACFLGSGQTDRGVLARARAGEYLVVYMTPEFAAAHGASFVQTFVGSICLFAIDECHCISEWGHDFRKDYASLGVLRETFADVPIVALTATATVDVQRHVIRTLQLRGDPLVRTTFDRPNLTYRVQTKPPGASAAQCMREDLRATPAIVYVPTVTALYSTTRRPEPSPSASW